MDDDERSVHASSFGAAAVAYAEHRPDYAQAAARWAAEFVHGQRRTAASLVETLATRAGVLVMPEQEREAALGRIRTFLAGRPETAGGEFTLPMLTGVLRVRRV